MNPICLAIMPTSIQLYVFHLCLEFVPHLLWSPKKDHLLFFFYFLFLLINKKKNNLSFSLKINKSKIYKGH